MEIEEFSQRPCICQTRPQSPKKTTIERAVSTSDLHESTSPENLIIDNVSEELIMSKGQMVSHNNKLLILYAVIIYTLCRSDYSSNFKQLYKNGTMHFKKSMP